MVRSKDEVQDNVDQEDIAAEAQTPRIFKRPIAPTKQEVDEHLAMNLSCRSWRPHRVAGTGSNKMHAASGGDQK